MLVTLAQYRRRGGRIHFGLLLAAEADDAGEGPGAEAGVGAGAGAGTGGAGAMSALPRAGGEGVEGHGEDVEGSAAWLRARFGLKVLQVGDVVVPSV